MLTYEDTLVSLGKAKADTDVVEARFLDLAPGKRVVQAVQFESDAPAFAGTMIMTWEVSPLEGGTRVTITAENVPAGISAEDHATGLASSLENLARYLEAQVAISPVDGRRGRA